MLHFSHHCNRLIGVCMATIREISKLTGFSIATVSKVLNGQSGVAAETVQNYRRSGEKPELPAEPERASPENGNNPHARHYRRGHHGFQHAGNYRRNRRLLRSARLSLHSGQPPIQQEVWPFVRIREPEKRTGAGHDRRNAVKTGRRHRIRRLPQPQYRAPYGPKGNPLRLRLLLQRKTPTYPR